MRFLLVQPLDYLLSSGGAHKANRLMMEGMVARGHQCRVIASGLGAGSGSPQQLLGQLAALGITPVSVSADVVHYWHNGVEVFSILGDFPHFHRLLLESVRDFAPTWVIITEDRTFLMVELALEVAPGRVVLIAHSQATLPFGPESFSADPTRLKLFGRIAGLLTVSDYVRDYIRRWGDTDATVIPFPSYGDGPFPRLGRFGHGRITMINPAPIKGLPIFLDLARRLPDQPFAAVRTWASTPADLAALRALPNVEIWEPTNDLNALFGQVRMLLAPSLWGESFGQVVVDAMLRGVPALASNVGGLPEAKLGVDYVLPVAPIPRYKPLVDLRSAPIPEVPAQDLGPWLRTVERLLSDPVEYERVAAESHAAALRFVGGLSVDRFLRYFAELRPAPALAVAAPATLAPMAEAAQIRDQAAALPPARRALLVARLRQRSDAGAAATISPVRRSGAEQEFPLSFAQRRLWFLNQLDPENPFYNTVVRYRPAAPLDPELLRRGLAALVRRHESLRSRIVARDGRPHQLIAPDAPAPLRYVDLRGLPEAERAEAAQALLLEEARRPFDLAAGPLLRAALVQTGDAEQTLLLGLHHIVCDAWSLGIITRDLERLMQADARPEAAELPPLALQYADYAVWQQSPAAAGARAAQLDYWRRQFTEPPPLLALPTDRPRPAQKHYRGAELIVAFPPGLQAAIDRFGQQERATPFMTLLSAYAAMLARYTDQDDLVIGTPIAGRTSRALEDLVGCFINMLPIRVRPQADGSFRSLIAQVRRLALDAYANQDLPLEQLIEDLNLPRDLSRTPLFQAAFGVQNAPIVTTGAGATALTLLGELNPGTAKFDLTLMVAGAGFSIEYDSDLFDRATVERMAGHYLTLLAAALADPDRPLAELPILPEAERRTLLEGWNATDRAYDPAPVAWRIAEQAARQPTRAAVVAAGVALSYGELLGRAAALAETLRGLGVGPNVPVGLFVERGPLLPVALLGVMLAGGAYVPIDPLYPAGRIAWMLEDSQAPVLITERRLGGALPAYTGAVVDVEEVASGGPHPLSPSPATQERGDARAPIRSSPLLAGEGPGVRTDDRPRPGPDDLAYIIYTSGSTGRPKGVQIPHRALSNFLAAMGEAPGIDTGDVLLAVTTISFDIAGLELLLPLLSGATVAIATREEAQDGARLADLIAASGATLMQATPATWRLLIESGWAGAPRLRVLCGGEALPPELAAQLRPRVAALWNMYGPTETTIWSTLWPVPAGADRITIGRPIANTQVYIVDRRLQPVPIGVPGEILIGGDGLAAGYRNREELSAERFLPSPFRAGGRVYRTGDLGRWRADGQLEHLGRLDHQVKLRGFRIELGEIESVLAQHPSLRQAAVVAREDRPGDQRLVAYYVGDPLAPEALRAHLRAQLPEYMLPAAFVSMAALPLTPNGKIDRRALPAPDAADLAPAEPYQPPQTPAEEQVAAIFAAVLGLERVGRAGSFFQLGGHSLLATQAIVRLRAAFGHELPLRLIFEAPGVAELAAAIAATGAAAQLPAPEPIRPVARDGELPLSFAQERLWFLDQLEPDSPFYNIALTLRLRGRLDLPALQRSLEALTARHEALRTSFPGADGRPFQRIHPPAPLALPLADVSGLPAERREAAMRDLAAAEARRPFRLAEGPLFRAGLIRLGDGEHVLTLTMHHIIADGWSLDVLLGELTRCYAAFSRGERPDLPALPVQAADVAHWQREQLRGERLAALLDYWRARLADAPLALELPTDAPRPALQTFNGATHGFSLPAPLAAAVRELARREGATLFMVLLAAFQVLLARSSGQDDLVVGTPIANRDRAELEPLVGLCVNTLALRADLSGNPGFRALLARVRETALGAFAHQELPFEQLVEALQPPRDMSRSVLFQAFFMLQRDPVRELQLGELAIEPIWLSPGTTQFELTLGVTDAADGLHGWLEYNTDLFRPSTAALMAERFVTLLGGIVADPDMPIGLQPILAPAERALILAPAEPLPAALPLVPALIAAQAARRPDAPALVFAGRSISYGELDATANRLAHHLRRQGLAPGARAAILAERSPLMVIAMLAVLRAGAAYVPLNPGTPRERVAAILRDSGAALLDLRGLQDIPGLSRADLPGLSRADLPGLQTPALRIDALGLEHEPATAPDLDLRPEQPAYVIYTSGSTGAPKGVQVSHGSLAVAYAAWAAAYGLDQITCHLQMASFGFDVCTGDIVRALCSGARLVICPQETLLDPAELLGLIVREGVDCAEFVPAVARGLAQHVRETGRRLEMFRLLVVGSDSWFMHEYAALRELCGPATRLVNSYGLTEATIDSTYFDGSSAPTSAERMVPIGRPFPGTSLHILDRNGQPVPIGVAGELFIGGRGVADGYLNRPDLTAERFVTVAGERRYRTGDMARYLADGSVELLGRGDGQVKLRGFRIELREIEATLSAHPAVHAAAVALREDEPGRPYLAGYIVPRQRVEGTGQTDDLQGAALIGDLRAHLRERLPDYMVPTAFAALEALPLLANGKLNYQALPRPEAPLQSAAFEAPRTETEAIIAEIWVQVLGDIPIGAHDSFFDIGGHSLIAMQVISRIRAAFALDLPLRSIFEAPTVATLAELVEAALLRELEGLSDDEATELLAGATSRLES